MRPFAALSGAGLLALTAEPSIAAGPTIVGPLPGYKCMALNLTAEQSMDPSTHVVFRSAPSDSAPVAGYAMMQVAVRDPARLVNGYLEARFPSGGEVWIKANQVVPYHSLGDPTARCVPVMLSNGRSGFDFPHGGS
jgi:hypothetical protein